MQAQKESPLSIDKGLGRYGIVISGSVSAGKSVGFAVSFAVGVGEGAAVAAGVSVALTVSVGSPCSGSAEGSAEGSVSSVCSTGADVACSVSATAGDAVTAIGSTLSCALQLHAVKHSRNAAQTAIRNRIALSCCPTECRWSGADPGSK